MRRRSADLILVIVAADLAGIVALALPLGFVWLRTILTLPLVLFLPGYALTAALFPGRAPGTAERLLFSLGLSLAVTAVGSVALDLTLWGLQAASWTLLLMGTTLVAGIIGIVRRRRIIPGGAVPSPRRRPLGLSWLQGVALSLAVAAGITAVSLAARPAPPQGGLGYSLLWMLPPADGSPDGARVGVTSNEFTTIDYDLQITLDGAPVGNWPDLSLAPGQSWEGALALSEGQPGALLEAVLYRDDQPGLVYRRATLWRYDEE